MNEVYTLKHCSKCRQIERWFPEAFEYVDAEQSDPQLLAVIGLTRVPSVRKDGKTIYIGDMKKSEVEALIND